MRNKIISRGGDRDEKINCNVISTINYAFGISGL